MTLEDTKWQFEKCDLCSNQKLEYDFDSLMHYTNDAFAKESGLKTIEVIGDPERVLAHSSEKHTFSRLDLLGILDLYGCTGKSTLQSCNTTRRKLVFCNGPIQYFFSFDELPLFTAGNCYDGTKNEDEKGIKETGIDCGGSCRPCSGLF